MPKVSLSGNERQDFTITHPQKISISGKVCTGRSAKGAWFGMGGITTDRHPAIATIRNKDTGRNVLTQSSPKGTHGCNSLNETIKVSAGNFVAVIEGTGLGDDYPSKGNMSISYERKKDTETSDGDEEDGGNYFSAVSSSFEEQTEDLPISPMYLGIGVGVLILFLLFK